MLGLLVLATAQGACEKETTSAMVREAAGDLFTAFGEMSREGVNSADEQLAALVPCLGEAITPVAAADLHRARGLADFTRRNAPAAQASFAAARRIDSNLRLPDVVSKTNPAYGDFDAIDLSTLDTESIPPPRSGVIVLDGAVSSKRTIGLPVVFQVQAGDSPTVSSLLAPGAAIPAYEGVPEPVERTSGRSKPLWIAAAGFGLVAVGLGAASAWSFNDFDEGTPGSWTDAKRTRTNALAGGAYGTGAVALGLGTTALVVGSRF